MTQSLQKLISLIILDQVQMFITLLVSVEDAINSMERDGYLKASYSPNAWWNKGWAETWPCGTADDANGQGLFSYDSASRTDTRGVLCAGDYDSNDVVQEIYSHLYL